MNAADKAWVTIRKKAAKRRLAAKKAWLTLRKHYPELAKAK